MQCAIHIVFSRWEKRWEKKKSRKRGREEERLHVTDFGSSPPGLNRLVLVTVQAWSGVQGSQRVCVSVCLSLEWSLQSQTLSCPKSLLNPKCSIEKESRTDWSIYFHSVVWRKECGRLYRTIQEYTGGKRTGWLTGYATKHIHMLFRIRLHALVVFCTKTVTIPLPFPV